MSGWRCAHCVRQNPTGQTAHTWNELQSHEHGTDQSCPIDRRKA